MRIQYVGTLKKVVVIAACFVLAACGVEEVERRQVEEINGLLYKVRHNEPFTGRVLNQPVEFLGLFSLGSCDVDVKSGLPDGKTLCKNDQGVTYLDLNYKAGRKHGKEIVYDSATGKKISENEWNEGREHGKHLKYDIESGKVVSEINYKNGVKSGSEKVWDPITKDLMTSLEWKDGKATGYRLGVGGESHYVNSERHGIQKRFDLFKGQLVVVNEQEYQHGVPNGINRSYDVYGNLTNDALVKEGKTVRKIVMGYTLDGKVQLSEVTLERDPNNTDPYGYPRLLKHGQEKEWDEEGVLIREIEWDYGRLKSAKRTIWDGANVVGSYGAVPAYEDGYIDISSESIYKDGIETIFTSDGTWFADIHWKNGKATHLFSVLPKELAEQNSRGIMRLNLENYERFQSIVRIPINFTPEFMKDSVANPNGFWGRSESLKFLDYEIVDGKTRSKETINKVVPVLIEEKEELIQVDPVLIKEKRESNQMVLSSTDSEAIDACVANKVADIRKQMGESYSIRYDVINKLKVNCSK